jgi:hypothetical protein
MTWPCPAWQNNTQELIFAFTVYSAQSSWHLLKLSAIYVELGQSIESHISFSYL